MPTVNNNQREGSRSNAHVGKEFEEMAFSYFKKNNIELSREYVVDIGISLKKEHKFDFGNEEVLVECKSYKWTNGDKVPSAKMRSLNEAMFYFYLAPNTYKKYLFILMNYNQKHCRSLVDYYVEKYYFFIPPEVEILEYYEEDGHCDVYRFNESTNKHQRV